MRKFLLILEDAHEQLLLCACQPMMVPNSLPEIDIIYSVVVERQCQFALLAYDQDSRAITHYNQQFIGEFSLDDSLT